MSAIVGALLASGACTPPPTTVPTPIGAHERFSGLVNGSRAGAVIVTSCPKSASPGTGHPTAGQTLSIVRDASGTGDTGSHSSVVFAQTGSSYNVVQIQRYDENAAIPTDVTVPCNGPGTVTFLQCFGIIACLDGSPDVVEVTFASITG